MKKQIIASIGIVSVLVAAITFSTVNHFKNRIRYCEVSKYFLGINIDTTTLETDGANYFVYYLKNKKDGSTFGNTEKMFSTWIMNKE